MFANVALLSATDSSLLAGTITDEQGTFRIKYGKSGKYILAASFIGYKPYRERLELTGQQESISKRIIMHQTQTVLDAVVISEERMKARQDLDKTTYYIDSAMLSASNTGVDVVQNIPGVRVDLFRNISMNGSENIVVLVDGRKRDASFLSQIHPDRIDRIEVKESSGGEYGAEVSGVINVVMKKKLRSGMSGHIYVNLPTEKNKVFSFPSVNLTYSTEKATLFTSYNGGFSFFDIKATETRVFTKKGASAEIEKNEYLDQRNWSHKLHYGMDYFMNERNQFSIYGFISRFSNEQSGRYFISKTDSLREKSSWHYEKDDHDINTSAYASVFYKHTFNGGAWLSFDANHYMLKSEGKLHLWSSDSEEEQYSQAQPNNRQVGLRFDLSFPMNENIILKSGLDLSLSYMDDDALPGFNYTERVLAGYFSTSYGRNSFQANAGLIAEYINNNPQGEEESRLIVLPNLQMKYGISGTDAILASYTKSIIRPSIFQLNPNPQEMDLFASISGNPELSPVLNQSLTLGYSLTFGSSFLKSGLFYQLSQDVIEQLTMLEDEVFLRKEVRNLGNISKVGIQTSGSLRLLKNISINPDIRIFSVRTNGNALAQANEIANKQAVNFATALSAVFVMPHDFSFSLSLQYNSEQTRIQSDYSEDALYFVSLDKVFFKCLKVGVTSVVPFSKAFTYQRIDIDGQNFSQSRSDRIQTSVFPVWFKLNYSFASGKDAKRIRRNKEFTESLPREGF